MRRNLEDYRVARAPKAARPGPLPETRANFLGTQQDSALNRRVIGSLLVCAALVGASLVLVS